MYRFVEKNDSIFLGAETMAKIVLHSSTNDVVSDDPVVDLCLTHYKGVNLVAFVNSIDKKAIKTLMTDVLNGKSSIDSKEYETNKYIKAMINDGIITKIKHSSKHTSVNVNNLQNTLAQLQISID